MRGVQEAGSGQQNMDKGKVVVKGESWLLLRKWVLLPNEPENKTEELNLGQKEDSDLDL